jgi:sodium/potassium-transporting ATPase subunit alpha
MAVTDIFAAGEEYTPEAAQHLFLSLKSSSSIHIALRNGVAADAITPSHLLQEDSCADVLNQLRILRALCNAGEFDASTLQIPIKDRKINGDATDQALLRLSESLGEVAQVRREWRKVAEVGFNSRNKFMVRVMKELGEGHVGDDAYVFRMRWMVWETDVLTNTSFLMVKVAPDILLPRCGHMLSDKGEMIPLDDLHIKRIEDVKDAWSHQGKRVILLARKTIKTLNSTHHEKEMLAAAKHGLALEPAVRVSRDCPREDHT